MNDQPRRPVFFWLVLLTCLVYAGFFAFTIYAVVRYYGVEKAPGWSAARNDGTGVGLFQTSTREARRPVTTSSATACWQLTATSVVR